jgi:Plasmid pRiA4b ORF-3-like protein
MTHSPQPSTATYPLRLVLAGISPMIWRRLLLSSETSIPQPHEYLQIVFAGSGEHRHRFRIQGKDYGMADRGGIRLEDNPHEMLLSRFRLRPRESFRYEYDFTAHWRVNIRREQILLREPPCALPVCTGGRGAAPGEEYFDALAYWQRLDRHRYEFPFEAMERMVVALRRWLDAEANPQQAIRDLDGLREAAERVPAYEEFQPRCCHRCEMNRKLRALGQEAA